MTDFDVMEHVQNGEVEPFGVLVRKYQEPLLNYFRRLGVYTDAEDLVQDTFVRVFKYRANYRPKAKFSTFLYRVARTVWIDWVRRKARREDFLTNHDQDLAPESLTAPELTPMESEVQEALAGLPEKLRAVVVLSVYQGLKYREVAEVLKVPVGTVKSRMSLAMGRLRESMHVRVDG